MYPPFLRSQKPARRHGVELTVLLGTTVVSSRFMPLPATVDVGDSPRFDVFFPLSELDGISPETHARLLADGFLTRPVNGVHSVGARLFEPAGADALRLRLPRGVVARLDGPEPREVVGAEVKLQAPCSGEITGAGDWRLRFRAEPTPSAVAWAHRPRPDFFTQAVAYGFALLTGLLALGHLRPKDFDLSQELTGTRTRLAILQLAPQRPPKPELIEEVVASRVQDLRVAPRRQPVAPRPRVQRAARPSLRAAAGKATTSALPAEAPPELGEGDGPAEATEPVGAGLEDGASPVPSVPSAPPPAAMRPLPPPPPVKVEVRQVVAPKRVFFPGVEYPEGARHLGLEGKVRMRLHLDRLGNVVKVEILAGLHPLLDRAAEAAARRARYEPARDNLGHPMSSTAVVTVRFELEEE
jgi:TonB family protein